jgi:hypothetical protein
MLHVQKAKHQNFGKASKKKKKEPKKTNIFHPQLESLRDNSIENIAINIQWPISRFLRILAQRGIMKNSSNMLDSDEFEVVKEMLNSRLLGIDQIERINAPDQFIRKSPVRYDAKKIGVYDKIETLGLGKLIYIRKR